MTGPCSNTPVRPLGRDPETAGDSTGLGSGKSPLVIPSGYVKNHRKIIGKP